MMVWAERIRRERLTADGFPPTARQIREGRLIPDLAAEQALASEYISFPDVAKHWAPLRREGSLKAAKSAALADLLEAAFDGHIPQLRLLHPGYGVEYLCGDRWCRDSDCVLYRPEDEETAHLDAAKLGQMRECSPLNNGGAYLLDQVAPYCWVPRAAVVAFLLARGVDRAVLVAWWPDLPTETAAALVVPLAQMRTAKQEAVRLALLDKYKDGSVPARLSWKAITESLREHYEQRMAEIGQPDVGGPSESTVRRVLDG